VLASRRLPVSVLVPETMPAPTHKKWQTNSHNFVFSSQCQWADCECIVGGERIPAHRCILVARSGFFEGTRCPSVQVEVQVQI
jgi:hypothetical protein